MPVIYEQRLDPVSKLVPNILKFQFTELFFFGCLSNNKYKFEIDIKKIPFFGYKDHFLAWKLIYLELRAKMLEIIKYD